ncbi:UNVERIFIED_CONTAM: hypothetical protein HDU68_002321 [Siphonaria sp. JEL0065]|nr:hypothetical protein HDU68_002321 [Siphonaria sp. JEL0065]
MNDSATQSSWNYPSSPAVVRPLTKTYLNAIHRILLTRETRLGFFVADEIVRNITNDDPISRIRSLFTPADTLIGDWSSENNFRYKPGKKIVFDKNSRRWAYESADSFSKNHLSTFEVCPASRLLYRVKCLFPSLEVDSEGPEGYKVIFATAFHHKYGIGFTEWKGSALLRFQFPTNNHQKYPSDFETKAARDFISFLNLVFCDDLIDTCFHPAAVISPNAVNATTKFLVAPFCVMDRVDDTRTAAVYKKWKVVENECLPLSKPAAQGQKHWIKCDPKTRQFAFIPAESIVSSEKLAFLFGKTAFQPIFEENDVVVSGSIVEEQEGKKKKKGREIGVWSATLALKQDGVVRVTFYDLFGLAHVRVQLLGTDDEKKEEGVAHVVELLDLICSDECVHPYDGTVAGSFS